MSTPADAMLQELIDHREIVDLVSRFCLMLDEKRIEGARAVYTDDVTVESGGAPAVTGFDRVVEHGRQGMEAFDRILHLATNVLVEIDGDRAVVRANLLIVGVYPGGDPASQVALAGTWDLDARREPAGWRLSRIRFERIWTTGTSA